MFKEKLGMVFSSKAFYIVFSILASVALWMYVEFSQNQDVIKRVDNVDVVFLNEDLLHDKKLVITEVSTEAVSLTFQGKNGVLAKLRSDTLSVTVDLSNVTSVGYISLPYKTIYPTDVGEKEISQVTKSVDLVTVKVDIMREKTVEVRGVYDGGTISSELLAQTPEFSPNTLTIFGPEAYVSKINTVWVPIKRENLSSTLTEEMDFIYLDENGVELEENMYAFLTSSVEKIRVTIPVRMVKEVALTAHLMYGAGATEENTKVTIAPSKITISGEPDLVRDYNSITLGTIDLTKLDSTGLSGAEMFPIVLENIYTNVSNITEALVSVELIGLETRSFTVVNLQAVNRPKDCTALIYTQSIDVKVRGRPEDLAVLTEANIRVVADLMNYSPGSAEVPAKVYFDGDTGDIGAIGEYKMFVTVLKN